MNRKYEQLSNDVVNSKEEKRLFARVVSAEFLDMKLYDDEAEYGVTFRNIEIDLKEKGHFTKGILITFHKEDNESTKMSYLDVIISDTIGTFISDWY